MKRLMPLNTLIGALASLLLPLVTAHAQSSSCASVRLDRGAGSIVNVPTTHQDQAQNCYAHAAATMMTGYLHKKSRNHSDFIVSPEKISALISIGNREIVSTALSATNGRTCGAVNLIKAYGACNRSSVLDLLNRFLAIHGNGQVGPSSQAVQGVLEAFSDSIQKVHRMIQRVESEQGRSILTEGLESIGVSRSAAKMIGERVEEVSKYGAEFLTNLVLSTTCIEEGGYLAPNSGSGPSCTKIDFVRANGQARQNLLSPQEFKQHLNGLLDRPLNRNYPVGIEFCFSVLHDSSKSYIKKRDFPLNIDYLNGPMGGTQNLSASCRFHAAVVIGRELRGGVCHVLIQNSWGTSCDYYGNRSNCEDGKIWIEQDALVQNLLRISHL